MLQLGLLEGKILPFPLTVEITLSFIDHSLGIIVHTVFAYGTTDIITGFGGLTYNDCIFLPPAGMPALFGLTTQKNRLPVLKQEDGPGQDPMLFYKIVNGNFRSGLASFRLIPEKKQIARNKSKDCR